MEHRPNLKLSGPNVPKRRRILLVFVAFVYLFVGLAHTIGCVDHALASQNQSSIEAKAMSNDGLDDGVPEHSQAAPHHCHFHAPAQLAALAAITIPSGHSVTPAFLTVTLQLADLSHLDPPPPRV